VTHSGAQSVRHGYQNFFEIPSSGRGSVTNHWQHHVNGMTPPSSPDPAQEVSMSEFSRRAFLKGGSAAIVAAGAFSAIPGLPALVGVADTQGPADVGAAESAAADTTSFGSVSEPIVAHIRDLASGEIGLLSGTDEITVHDPQLAASIFRAMH
jgi:hypothetical protein